MRTVVLAISELLLPDMLFLLLLYPERQSTQRMRNCLSLAVAWEMLQCAAIGFKFQEQRQSNGKSVRFLAVVPDKWPPHLDADLAGLGHLWWNVCEKDPQVKVVGREALDWLRILYDSSYRGPVEMTSARAIREGVVEQRKESAFLIFKKTVTVLSSAGLDMAKLMREDAENALAALQAGPVDPAVFPPRIWAAALLSEFFGLGPGPSGESSISPLALHSLRTAGIVNIHFPRLVERVAARQN